MTEKEAWAALQRRQSRMGRHALTVWAVWMACYAAWNITFGFHWASYVIALGVFLWALNYFVQRPLVKAMETWDAAMTAEWNVPPPLMQGTIMLYDDSHGFKVGDQVPMDEHLYEVINVNGSEIEVREVPRS